MYCLTFTFFFRKTLLSSCTIRFFLFPHTWWTRKKRRTSEYTLAYFRLEFIYLRLNVIKPRNLLFIIISSPLSPSSSMALLTVFLLICVLYSVHILLSLTRTRRLGEWWYSVSREQKRGREKRKERERESSFYYGHNWERYENLKLNECIWPLDWTFENAKT